MENPLENFTSECPICSGREVATGRTELREGDKTYFEFRCTECNSVGWEWSRDTDPKTRTQ